MRIVHFAHSETERIVKKSAREERYERCMLMIKNQNFEDIKQAEKLFADRIKAIEQKLKLLEL